MPFTSSLTSTAPSLARPRSDDKARESLSRAAWRRWTGPSEPYLGPPPRFCFVFFCGGVDVENVENTENTLQNEVCLRNIKEKRVDNRFLRASSFSNRNCKSSSIIKSSTRSAYIRALASGTNDIEMCSRLGFLPRPQTGRNASARPWPHPKHFCVEKPRCKRRVKLFTLVCNLLPKVFGSFTYKNRVFCFLYTSNNTQNKTFKHNHEAERPWTASRRCLCTGVFKWL